MPKTINFAHNINKQRTISYEQQAKLEVLSAVNSIDSIAELNEFKDLVAHFFAAKAQKAIDAMCESGEITPAMIEAWGEEHMRTPYRYAAARGLFLDSGRKGVGGYYVYVGRSVRAVLTNKSYDITLPDGSSFTSKMNTNLNLTYSRTISNTYGTIVLPFKPTTADDVTFYTVKTLSGSNLSIEEVALSNVEANRPYIFKAEAAGTLTFSAENTTVYAATGLTENTTECGVTIVGSYTQMGSEDYIDAANDTSYDYYYISGGKFWHATGTLEVNAYRAYLRVAKSNTNPAKLNIMLDDETTGIQSLSNPTIENSAVYNIAGQRVNASHKGIVIVNGKQYLNK